MNASRPATSPERQQVRCDLCWKTFTFSSREAVPNWCPECRIGVLRAIEWAEKG